MCWYEESKIKRSRATNRDATALKNVHINMDCRGKWIIIDTDGLQIFHDAQQIKVSENVSDEI